MTATITGRNVVDGIVTEWFVQDVDGVQSVTVGRAAAYDLAADLGMVNASEADEDAIEEYLENAVGTEFDVPVDYFA